jgi:hypothetical protein
VNINNEGFAFGISFVLMVAVFVGLLIWALNG